MFPLADGFDIASPDRNDEEDNADAPNLLTRPHQDEDGGENTAEEEEERAGEVPITASASVTHNDGTVATSRHTLRSNSGSGSATENDEAKTTSVTCNDESGHGNGESSDSSDDEDDEQYTRASLDDDEESALSDDQNSRSSSSSSGSGSSGEEGTLFTENVSGSIQQLKKKLKTEIQYSSSSTVEAGIEASVMVARSEAYEKLLLYAYAALSVPPPAGALAEKGEGKASNNNHALYPTVLSPTGRTDMTKLLTRLRTQSIEVLKLNREKRWQPRFLTITKEVTWFRHRSNGQSFVSGNGISVNSYPRGLLWLKKFDPSKPQHSNVLSSIDKNGKGGILFTDIEHVSVTKDNHPLSLKQRRKFKDGITFVVHASSNTNGGTKSNRQILFRCSNKEDAFALSSGFQALLDRIKDDAKTDQSRSQGQLKKLSIEAATGFTGAPLSTAAKAFSPKALKSPMADDRWEV